MSQNNQAEMHKIDINKVLKMHLSTLGELFSDGLSSNDYPQHIFRPKYQPREADDPYFIFDAISTRMLAQWWLSIEHFKLNSKIKTDAKDKLTKLEYEVGKITGKQIPTPTTMSRVDKEFDEVCSDYTRMATDEVNDEEVKGLRELLEPCKDDESLFFYSSDLVVENLQLYMSNMINHFEEQTRKLSFVTLHTIMVEGLEEIKKRSQLQFKKNNKESNQNIKWFRSTREEIQNRLTQIHKGKSNTKTAKYLRLLWEFEKNFETLDLRRFYKPSGKLNELNTLRNQAMHARKKSANDYSMDNLIVCYKEVKDLFLTIEDDDEFRKHICGDDKSPGFTLKDLEK